MNKRPIVLTLAASALLALGVKVFVFPDRADPAEHLVELQARAQESGVDPALMVREITRVLEDPRTREDTETRAALLWLRAEVHAAARHYPDARADLEQHAVVLGRATPAAVLRTAELEALEGRAMDAYTRVQRLLEVDDRLYDGWRLAGQLERQLARELREKALATTRALLVRASRERSLEILEELCAREADDPRRVQLASELADLYLPSNSDELAQAIELASDAAARNAAARASLARSLAGGPDGRTVAALIELLHEADQAELGVELGMATYPEGSEPAEVFEKLIDAMLDAGQNDRFADRVRTFPWSPAEVEAELCVRVLGLLYSSGAWIEDRTRIAMLAPLRCLRVLNRPDMESALNLYMGLSSYANARATGEDSRAVANYERAIQSFERFIISGNRIDPFPGARAVAHLYRARAWRALDDERREREDLGRALTPSLDVDGEAWLAHVTGEDFLRHAELVLKQPQRGARRPEEDWTRGMARLPARAYDLMERWEEIGQASLAETGHDLERLFTNMRAAGSAAPSVDVGPWTRWKLAQTFLERRNVNAAVVASRRLLDQYPGLLPAHDILIEAQLERGSRIQVVDDILARLELVGPDERNARYTAEVGLASFGPTQLLRAMQLDPRGIGRRVVAPRLMSAGEPERALTSLGPPRKDEPPATRLLRAQALEALGALEEAEPLYTGLLDEPAHRDAALAALVRFRLTAPPNEPIGPIGDVLMQCLAEDEEPPTGLALQVIDRALTGKSGDLAHVVLEQLDARAATRSGEVLWRLGLERLLSGHHDAALEAFARAEAFLADDRVALARIVLAIEDRDWRAIAPLVVLVRKSDAEPSALADAILTLLQERTEAARELAMAGAMAEPRSAEWLLVHAATQTLLDQDFPVPGFFGRDAKDATMRILRGTEHVLRDPREILGILLLFELPNTDPWIEDALLRLDPASEELWSNYLRARLATRGGQWQLAEFLWKQLTRFDRRFGPGWNGLLETVEALAEDPWEEAVLRVRVDRRNSMARAAGTSDLDRAIDEAANQILSGDPEAAIAALTPAVLDGSARASNARLLLGRLNASLGRYVDADRAVAQLLPDARMSSDGHWIAEYVRWLTEGSRPTVEEDQRLAPGKVLARLELLEERFPNDPLFPLERARASVGQVASPALALGLTLRILDEFRSRSRDISFHLLRPGSSLAWSEFLLDLSPREAERFLLRELERAPGQIDLWSLLAEALQAQDRAPDALELLASIVQMSGDPHAIHAYARALVASGSPAGAVHAVLDTIPEGQDPYGPARGRFLRALAELQGARASLQVALQILSSLWESADSQPGVDPLVLGRTYAGVLLRRGADADLAKLSPVLEELDRRPLGSYARTVLEAYRSLALYRLSPDGQRRARADRADGARGSRAREAEEEARAADDDGESGEEPAATKRAPGARGENRPRRARAPQEDSVEGAESRSAEDEPLPERGRKSAQKQGKNGSEGEDGAERSEPETEPAKKPRQPRQQNQTKNPPKGAANEGEGARATSGGGGDEGSG